MKKNVIGKRGELIQKVATFVFVRPTEAFIGCSSIFSLVAAAGGACIVLAGTEKMQGHQPLFRDNDPVDLAWPYVLTRETDQ